MKKFMRLRWSLRVGTSSLTLLVLGAWAVNEVWAFQYLRLSGHPADAWHVGAELGTYCVIWTDSSAINEVTMRACEGWQFGRAGWQAGHEHRVWLPRAQYVAGRTAFVVLPTWVPATALWMLFASTFLPRTSGGDGCARCGYPIGGLPAHRCPECGLACGSILPA